MGRGWEEEVETQLGRGAALGALAGGTPHTHLHKVVARSGGEDGLLGLFRSSELGWGEGRV